MRYNGLELASINGEHYRVADPSWVNPFDAEYSKAAGGRWNPPGEFGACYLNSDVETARANLFQILTSRLSGTPFTFDDIDEAELPALVTCEFPTVIVLDVVTDAGLEDADLPTTYPLDEAGQTVPWSRCQPVGRQAHESRWPIPDFYTATPAEHRENCPGLSVRSAAQRAPADGLELVWFPDNGGPLTASGPPQAFADWYGPWDGP